MAKFCEHCGHPLEEGQQVCLGCGRLLNSNVKKQKKKEVSKATRGLILGLCSFLAWMIPLFGYPVAICAIVYSSQSLRETKEEKEKAVLGLLFGIIFLVATLVNSILGVMNTL